MFSSQMLETLIEKNVKEKFSSNLFYSWQQSFYEEHIIEDNISLDWAND